MAAVCRELVSGELEFPANNREFPEFGVSMPIPGPFDPYFRAVTREFPAYPNREFFEAEQGIFRREQGITETPTKFPDLIPIQLTKLG